MLSCPSPRIERHGRLLVVRDDLVNGGSKARFLPALIAGAPEVVYAGPAWGGAAVALTVTARELGIPVTLFYAGRKRWTARQEFAHSHGARIVEVRPGYLSVVRARAKQYCAETGARLLDWGLPQVEAEVVRVAQALATDEVPEIWVAAGSGTMLRGLARAFGAGRVVGVQVGHTLTPEETAGCRVYPHPLLFEQRTTARPPFPSCRHYDAKAWEMAARRAPEGALFWNVMGEVA